MHAHAEDEPPIRQFGSATRCKAGLQRHGAAHGIHDTLEFDQKAIAGRLNDTAAELWN